MPKPVLVSVDYFKKGRFVTTMHFRIMPHFYIEWGLWMVGADDIEKYVQDKFPHLTSPDYEYFLNNK